LFNTNTTECVVVCSLYTPCNKNKNKNKNGKGNKGNTAVHMSLSEAYLNKLHFG